MAKPYVLDRVAADLARGCTHPAIQRLGSLVSAHPHDLDLRRRLAAVHRRVGNRIQAGRWDYLTIGADSRDTRAFERAFPSAMARLREVRWPQRAGQAATEHARRRLAKLMAAAAAEQPRVRRPARHPEPAVRPALGRSDHGGRLRSTARVLATVHALGRRPTQPATVLAVCFGMLMATPLAALGLITIVQWIV